jgi:hypothetical protein
MQQHFWDECTKKSCHSRGVMTKGLSKVMYADTRTRRALDYITLGEGDGTRAPWV